MSNIQWKRIMIKGKVSKYQIANNGSVMNDNGTIMKPYLINSGYFCIKLSMDDERYNFLIHRLVAEYFIPNPNNLPVVNHKDGNKQNDWDWNLEWATSKDNMIHAASNVLLKPKVGIDNLFAIHSEKQIHQACQMIESGKYLPNEISQVTGVSRKTLEGIIHRGKWKHISSQYDFSKYNGGKGSRWDDKTVATVQILRDKGLNTSSEILNRMGMPNTDPNRQRVRRILNKAESSTTIHWVVFDFESI